MASWAQSFRATLLGGVLFLLPLILAAWLLTKAVEILERVSQPLLDAVGLHSIGGIALGTLVSIGILILLSFLAGLIARTKVGQAAFSGLEHSVLNLLPQWRMARGLLESFDSSRTSHTEVVLVPTDAGWCLGVVLEKPDEDWWSVFIPGSPQWTSGSLSYVQSKQVHPTGLTLAEAILILRRCGTGSAAVHLLLASLERKQLL